MKNCTGYQRKKAGREAKKYVYIRSKPRTQNTAHHSLDECADDATACNYIW